MTLRHSFCRTSSQENALMTVYLIKDGAVQIDYLEQGDMTLKTVGNEQAILTVYDLCVGRGRWVPQFKNWIIFKQNADAVLLSIEKLATGKA